MARPRKDASGHTFWITRETWEQFTQECETAGLKHHSPVVEALLQWFIAKMREEKKDA